MCPRSSSKKAWKLRPGLAPFFLIFALTSLVDAGQPAIELPTGFEDVQLGIGVDNLRELRPEVEVFEVLSDPNEARAPRDDLFIEELRNSDFDFADFAFSSGKLCVLKWSLLGKHSDFSARRSRILARSFQRWGEDFEKMIYADRGLGEKNPALEEFLLPSLRWNLGQTVALLVYSPSGQGDEGAPGPGDAKTLEELLIILIYNEDCVPASLGGFLGKFRPAIEVPPNLFRDLKSLSAKRPASSEVGT